MKLKKKKQASFIWLTVYRKYAESKLDKVYQIYCVCELYVTVFACFVHRSSAAPRVKLAMKRRSTV